MPVRKPSFESGRSLQAQRLPLTSLPLCVQVIGCAECLGPLDEPNFFFAGVCACQSLAHRACHALAPTWLSSHHTPLPQQAGRRRCGDPVRCFPGQVQQCLPVSSSHRCSSPRADDGIGPSVDEFFTLSLGGMVTVSAPACRPAPPRASECPPRAHRPRPLRCAAAEHVERLDLRRRPLRMDALVCQRREVEREARASRPATRRNSDGHRVVCRIHLERKNVECNCLTRLPLFADRRR